MSNLPPPPPPPPGGTPSPPPPGSGDANPGSGFSPPPPPGQGYAPPGGQPGYAPPPGAYGGPGGAPVAQPGVPPGYQQKEKMVAGLLGILLGGFGAHSFYLGNTTKGIIQLLVSIFTCWIGSIWGLIEGIMILTGSTNTDANGVPLKG